MTTKLRGHSCSGETTGGDNQKAVMIPKMAAILAMDRQAGRLGAGQEVTAAYIRDAVQ